MVTAKVSTIFSNVERLPRRSWWPFVSKTDLRNAVKVIMEAIDTFAASVNAAFDAIGTNVDTLVTSVDATNTSLTGIAGDVAELKKEIAALQNTPADLDASTETPPTPPTA